MRRTANDEHGRIGDLVHIRAVGENGFEARLVHAIDQILHLFRFVQHDRLRARNGFRQILHSQNGRQFNRAQRVVGVKFPRIQQLSRVILVRRDTFVTDLFAFAIQLLLPGRDALFRRRHFVVRPLQFRLRLFDLLVQSGGIRHKSVDPFLHGFLLAVIEILLLFFDFLFV